MSISYENLLEDFNLPLKTIAIFCVLSDYFQIPANYMQCFSEERRENRYEHEAQPNSSLASFYSLKATEPHPQKPVIFC